MLCYPTNVRASSSLSLIVYIVVTLSKPWLHIWLRRRNAGSNGDKCQKRAREREWERERLASQKPSIRKRCWKALGEGRKTWGPQLPPRAGEIIHLACYLSLLWQHWRSLLVEKGGKNTLDRKRYSCRQGLKRQLRLESHANILREITRRWLIWKLFMESWS